MEAKFKVAELLPLKMYLFTLREVIMVRSSSMGQDFIINSQFFEHRYLKVPSYIKENSLGQFSFTFQLKITQTSDISK